MDLEDKSPYLPIMMSQRKDMWKKLSNLVRDQYAGFEISEKGDSVRMVFISGVPTPLDMHTSSTISRIALTDEGEFHRTVPVLNFTNDSNSTEVRPDVSRDT